MLLICLSFLLFIFRGRSQQTQDSQKKLSLLRLQIFLDSLEHLVSMFCLLRLEVACKFNLVDPLHPVASPELLPLKLVDVEFVHSLEQVLAGFEPALLSSFESVEGNIAEPKQFLFGRAILPSLDQLQVLNFPKLGEVLFELVC